MVSGRHCNSVIWVAGVPFESTHDVTWPLESGVTLSVGTDNDDASAMSRASADAHSDRSETATAVRHFGWIIPAPFVNLHKIHAHSADADDTSMSTANTAARIDTVMVRTFIGRLPFTACRVRVRSLPADSPRRTRVAVCAPSR